jgi:hypothetical protein
VKAYSFRLQGVQRVRGLEVARARQQVAALARSLAAARSREFELTTSYSSRIIELGETSAHEFAAHQEQEHRLAGSLAVATEERRTIEAQLARARSEAVQAETRANVLDRLAERRRSEWVGELRHEEALDLDEFATLRAAAIAIESNHVD